MKAIRAMSAINMKKHIKTYMQYFGHGEQDVILCEVCGAKAVDIHHIDNDRKNNDITNLIAVCRDCHFHAHGDKIFWSKEIYQALHEKYLDGKNR